MACLLDQANIFEISGRIIFEKNTQTANLLDPNLTRYCTLPPLTLEGFGSRINNSKPGGCIDDDPL